MSLVGLAGGLTNVMDKVQSTFTPASIANLNLWLDPNKGIATSSGHVTSWTDQSSNAFVFSNTGTLITVGTGLNGKTSLTFNGASYLSNGSVNIGSFINTAAYTMLIVFQYTGSATEASAGNSYLNPAIISDSGSYWFKCVSTTKLGNAQFDGAYEDDQITINTGTNYYAIIQYDGTKLYTAINGAALSAGTACGNAVTTHSTVIGANYNAGADYVGYLGDVISYTSVLNGTQIGQLNTWAQARYGL